MNEQTSTPTPRLEAVTLKLTALSVTAYSNPHRLFAWSSSASTDRLAMSEDLLPLAGLPIYRQLSDEQRWRLGLLEAVNFFSLNIGGERELMTGLAQRLYHGRPAFISRYLQHFLHEENAHTAVFARFCLDYGGLIFPDRQLRFPREFLPGEEEFLFFTRVLIFEEIAHFYNRRIAADQDVWSLARDINRYHAEDETRHIAFGRLLVEEIWERFAPEWQPDEKKRIGQYLTRYIATVLHSYVNPDVYRTIGLGICATEDVPARVVAEPWAIDAGGRAALPAGIRQQILESPHWISLAEESTVRITRFLKKIGASGDV